MKETSAAIENQNHSEENHQLTRKILKDRARSLALKPEEAADRHGRYADVLQVSLLKEVYAFEAKYVKKTHISQGLTAIPCTPSLIAGVVNVRGEIITVIDTKTLLGLPVDRADDAKIVILEVGDVKMGCLVDDVLGVTALKMDNLQPPLVTFPTQGARYIAGLAEGPVAVIDALALINDRLIIVDEEVIG